MRSADTSALKPEILQTKQEWDELTIVIHENEKRFKYSLHSSVPKTGQFVMSVGSKMEFVMCLLMRIQNRGGILQPERASIPAPGVFTVGGYCAAQDDTSKDSVHEDGREDGVWELPGLVALP